MTEMEKTVEIGSLFEIYGLLLTKKQQAIVEAYYDEDLSLTEIADNLEISKQAVSDQLRRATGKLYVYEHQLRLLSHSILLRDVIRQVNAVLSRYEQDDLKRCQQLLDGLVAAFDGAAPAESGE